MAIAGFTGTQRGMTERQLTAVRGLLPRATVLHHGDCIGADEQAHRLAMAAGIDVIIHPPDDASKRAWCSGADHMWKEKPYLARNHDIVDSADGLIAAPGEFGEQLRSGTWATIRYAKKRGKPVIIVLPDGSIRKSR